MPKPFVLGPEYASLQRQNGKEQPQVRRLPLDRASILGAMSIPTPRASIFDAAAKEQRHLLIAIRKGLPRKVYSIWRAMSGNGPAASTRPTHTARTMGAKSYTYPASESCAVAPFSAQ